MSKSAEDKIARGGLKFVIGLFVYAFTTSIVLGAVAFWWGAQSYNGAGPLEKETLFTVERGTGLNQIATKLEDAGAIDNRFLFIAGTRILGMASDLKAGEYQLDPSISAKDIAIKLRDHDVFGRRVTIREGLTSFEIVRLLKGVKELSDDITTVPPEGSLLPNTYDYQLNETRDAVLGRLSNNMVSTLITLCELEATVKDFQNLLSLECGDAPLRTVKDVLTLASIVEKETSVPKERAKVAGVFINRLKRGIALQTDPTVIYAITKGEHKNEGKGPLGRRLLRKDLEYDSPYNTYKYPGLPPGPIANPGKASIEAVLNPASHDYIFFVADGTGGHAFAKTLREHNSNVAKWRKIRRAQSKKN